MFAGERSGARTPKKPFVAILSDLRRRFAALDRAYASFGLLKIWRGGSNIREIVNASCAMLINADKTLKERLIPMRSLALISVLATLAAAPAVAQSSRVTFSLGQTETPSTAMAMTWHSAPRPAGWSYAAGVYATSEGAGWIGGGVSYTLRPGNSGFFVRGTVMPGLYHQGSDRDLGGAVELGTSLEFGMALRNEAELSLMLTHRSNAGIYSRNPGLNMVSVAYTIPLN